MRRSKYAAAAAVAAALCMGTAACGSSGKHTSTSPSATPGANLTGSPIKIGVLVAETGLEQQQMAAVPGTARAWADQVNATGGLGGHPVQMVIEDTQNNPATYQTDEQTLVESDHVVAVLTSDDYADTAGAAYLQQHNIPVIGGNAFDATSWGVRPNFLTNSPPAPYSATATAAAAKAYGAKSYGALLCDEGAACLQVEPLLKTAASDYGLKWTGIQQASETAANYTAQCLNFVQTKTDYIVGAAPLETIAKAVPACAQQGFQGAWGINSDDWVQASLQKLTGTFVGNSGGFPWWVNVPAVNAFRSAMARYSPSTNYRSTSATDVWQALALFQKAMASPPQTVTPATVLNAYYGIKNETLGGLLPQPVSYSATTPMKVDCFWIFDYKGGSENPTLLTNGPSGNGQSGPLQSSCYRSS